MGDYNAPPPGGSGGPPSNPGGPQGPEFSGYGMPAYPPTSNDLQTDNGGFFAALFDFSFTQFVTPKIVKLVYVLAMIALALGYVVFVISAFAENAAVGVVVLFLGAVFVLVYLAFIRMTLEFYYAIVRMSQDINQRLPRA